MYRVREGGFPDGDETIPMGGRSFSMKNAVCSGVRPPPIRPALTALGCTAVLANRGPRGPLASVAYDGGQFTPHRGTLAMSAG